MSTSQYPLVSVVMPAYNVEAYLKEAVQSVLNQTYKHFELIVADDGSTDSTISVLSSFSDKRIVRLLHPQNIGYVENMNSLFREAKGDFIIIQDADDYCTESRLQVLLDYLMGNPDVDMVGSSHIKVNDERKEEYIPAITGRSIIAQSFSEMTDPLPVLNGTVMFRRKIIDQGFFFRQLKYMAWGHPLTNINRGQDDDWLFRVSESFVMDNVEEYLYYYRSNSSSMTLNPANTTYHSLFTGQFVRFLKSQRMAHEKDLLEQKKWREIDGFFMDQMRQINSTEPAYLELYIAHKFLGQGKRGAALKWLFKALWKEASNLFIWKKIVHVILNKK